MHEIDTGDSDLITRPPKPVSHYYGDTMRTLLIIAGLAVLFAMLVDAEFRSLYVIVEVLGVLAFVVLAGLTSPVSRPPIVTTTLLAAAAFIFFEYLAVGAYLEARSFLGIVFLTRQAIAILLLSVVYFGTKTLRGMAGR